MTMDRRGVPRLARALGERLAFLATIGAFAASCSLVGGFSEDRVAGEGAGGASSVASTSSSVASTSGSTGGGDVTSSTTSASSGGGQGGQTSTSTGQGGDGGAMGAGGSGDAGGPVAAWPDSATVFCSDGAVAAPCPDGGEALFGQDGNVIGALSGYETDGELVRDPVTGLVWQAGQTEVAASWDEANAACEGLRIGGFSGWRLPSMRELTSLWDAGAEVPPRLDQQAFPSPITNLWTSTFQANTDVPAIVRFDPNTLVGFDAAGTAAARCVLGADHVPILSSDGEVVGDVSTGLMWEQAPSNREVTWASALAECQDLTNQFDDWRLASLKELATIVDPTRTPALPSELADWAPGVRWSSTPNPGNPVNAFAFNLRVDPPAGHAIVSNMTMSTTRYAACVRDFL